MATTKATTLAHGQSGLITSGTLADARIPNLATSKITSGTFADARIASSNVTQHEGSIDALASNPTVTLGSNATFPTKVTDRTVWYMGDKAATNTTFDFYRVPPHATGGGQIRVTGCAPTGFSSVVSADYVMIENGTGTGNAVSFAYQMGNHGSSYATHAQSNVEVSGLSFTQYNLRFLSFLNIGSTHFEDVIAEGDMFGFRFSHGGGENVYGLGVKIVWRF